MKQLPSTRSALQAIVIVFGALLGSVAISEPVLAQVQAPARIDSKARAKSAFVARDTAIIVSVRPAEAPEVDGLLKVLTLMADLGDIGLAPAEVEECTLRLVEVDQDEEPIIILRCTKPHDWQALTKRLGDWTAQAPEPGGEIFCRDHRPTASRAYVRPDDRTIVFGSLEGVRAIVRGTSQDAQPDWAPLWGSLAKMPAAILVDAVTLSRLLRGPGGAQNTPFDPIFEDATIGWIVAEKVPGGLLSRGTIECHSPEAATRVAAQFDQFRAMAREAFVTPASSPEDQKKVLALLDFSMSTEGSLVVANSTVEFSSQSLSPILATAPRQDVHKMRQIAIAMHNYHSANGHFPAAVIMGPDGKTPHSWRVALLPYLDRGDVYKRYKMDEPWNSPNNLARIKEAADLFSPTSDSDDCGYFLLTGPETPFDGENGPPLRSITDGTSWTVAFVEAKRPIPWTKPQDIPYDSKRPLPELGGFAPEGFWAAFLDAHLELLPKMTDASVLRALITPAGSEQLSRDGGSFKLEQAQ